MARPATKPSVNDEAAIARLCEALIAGESMAKACTRDDCPSSTAVYLRMASDEGFRSTIARAREAQQHAIIDQTVDMADEATPENWQAVKLKIWARQWRAGKLAPKIYGERSAVEHSGPEGGALKFVIYGAQEAKDADEWAKLNPPPV